MNNQLVSFAFDDNGYVDGMQFVFDAFNTRFNPPGRGDPAFFDGAPVRVTFLMKGDNIAGKDAGALKRAWRTARENGNEIAVHTFSHPLGVTIDWTASPPLRRDTLDLEGWQGEIERCADILVKEIGVSRNELAGFRTPYIAHNDAVYAAMQKCGIRYDCGIEEGWQDDADGTNFPWPYTLDRGSPGDAWLSRERFGLDRPIIGSHPGLVELPLYVLVVPPDDRCAEYGTRAGFRNRVQGAKITGLDWNMWFQHFLDPGDALAILKYSFDLRLAGNRCPFLFGAHSDIYSMDYDRFDLSADSRRRIKATGPERRDVLRAFLDYALSFPETRVAAMKDIAAMDVTAGPISARQ